MQEACRLRIQKCLSGRYEMHYDTIEECRERKMIERDEMPSDEGD
jgi:hypothetical protein